MHCPFCNDDDTKVVDSRYSEGNNQVKRRRECKACHNRFTTFESVELNMPRVIKQSGDREPFDEQKLRDGVMRALERRPVSMEKIDLMINEVKHHTLATGDREVKSRVIGEWVMKGLRHLDHVAYVRFASVYRDFKDLDDFKAEISRLS